MRIVFAGTPAFSASCLQALLDAPDIELVGVVSQPDRKSGRGMKLTPSPVKKLALERGIDVITPERLRDDADALQWLESKACDVLVVVAFGMILPKSWLDAPRVAPVNVHASLLPRWRGAAPIERALLSGDAQTGVGIMHMEEGLDTGGVYASASIPISSHTLGHELWMQLSALGNTLLLETLPRIVDGRCVPVPQDESGVTYAAKLHNDERIVDWNMSAVDVDRHVRTFAPKPGMRTLRDGKWLKIISGEVLDGLLPTKAAGLVHDIDLPAIVCGDGSLYRLLEVQPEGKQVMSAADYVRGARLQAGDVLGA